MPTRKLLTINLRIDSIVYKLNSLTIASDGSVHVAYANRKWIDHVSPGVTPMKLTYHHSGVRNHITAGPQNRRLPEIAGHAQPPIADVNEPQPIGYMSLWKINEGFIPLLDQDKPNRGYEHILVVEGSRYEHLTLYYYLVGKNYIITQPQRDYRETLRYSAGGIR